MNIYLQNGVFRTLVVIAYLLHFHRWQSVLYLGGTVSNFILRLYLVHSIKSFINTFASYVSAEFLWFSWHGNDVDDTWCSKSFLGFFGGHGGLTLPSDLRFRSQNLFVEYISGLNVATKCGFVRWKMHTQVSHTGCFKKYYEVKWLMTRT